jgi:hypothetical protein
MVVQGFRGVGKSWITVAFALWNLLNDPEKKIMIVSASQPLADDFVKFCLSLIRHPELAVLNHLAPKDDQRSRGNLFDVGPAGASKDPSLKAVGITGQLTGSRADLIIPDDVEIPKNSMTHLMRERLAELVKEFDAIIKPGGRIIYLGTPQVEQSLYTRLEARGYRTYVWPAEVPASLAPYRGRLAPYPLQIVEAGRVAAGTPLDPKRFSREDLDERRASYGRTGYALQFMLDTTPSESDKHPLKCSDLIVSSMDTMMGPVKVVWGADKELTVNDLACGGYDGDRWHRAAWKSPEMAEWHGTVMAIDPSGRGKDETAYAVVRQMHGMLYLVDSGGFREGFSERTLEGLARTAIRHRVNYIIDELNYGGGMFRQMLKPVVLRIAAAAKVDPPMFDEEWNGWSSTVKEFRILDTLEPVSQSHRLVIERKVIEKDYETQAENPHYSLIFQMTRMERLKGALAHEDRLEALSMAVSYWIERLNRDKDEALFTHKEDLLQKDLDRFMENALGRPIEGPRWFTI